MKKTKLFLSIASMCFALSVLVFGILASGDDIFYNINGTLTYDVNNCFVAVETSIYYSPDPLDLDEMYSQMENIVDEGDISNLELYEVSYYNSYTDTYDGANVKSLDLNFEGRSNGSPKFAYFLKLEVTNLCAFDVNFGVNTPIEMPNNVYSINSGLYTGIGRNETCILSIAFGLESITTNITAGRDQELPTYSAMLKVEPDDENTTLNVYNFDSSTQAISKSNQLENMEMDLYVPSYYNRKKVLKATDFSNCTELTSIHIPSTVQEIGEGIFANCPGLTSLTLPFIGKANYESYEDVYDRENGYWLRATIFHIFGDEEKDGLFGISINTECIGAYEKNWVYAYMPANLQEVTILYGCKAICQDAFYFGEQSNESIETINLPYGLRRIEYDAFNCCAVLKNISLPKTLEYLGNYCFENCTSLTSVTIPSSVTYVGEGAFDYCEGLKAIMIKGGNVEIELDSHPFFYCGNGYYFENRGGYKIYIDENYYDIYENNPNWEVYFEAGVVVCGNLIIPFEITYQVNDGQITDNRGWSEMPLVNLLNTTDESVWSQFDSDVVSDYNMGSSANSIYQNVGDKTNAIYTDVNVIPSDEIEYSIRARSGCKVYIYYFELGSSDTFVSDTYQHELLFRRSDVIIKNIQFGRDVYKIRFVLVRYEAVTDEHVKSGDREYFDKAVKIIPSQITSSQYANLRLTPFNIEDIESGNGNSESFVGYYQPGYDIGLPYMMTVPYADYNFMSWITDENDEESTIATIPASQVSGNTSITLYALWNKNIRYVYLNIGSGYIKVDGISVTQFGTNVPITDILDAAFSTQAIKNCMTSQGISYDSNGYPTSRQIDYIYIDQSKKGAVASFVDGNWSVNSSNSINSSEINSNKAIHFTTGDVYIVIQWR